VPLHHEVPAGHQLAGQQYRARGKVSRGRDSRGARMTINVKASKVDEVDEQDD